MKKKTLTALLAMTLVLGLAVLTGCGGGGSFGTETMNDNSITCTAENAEKESGTIVDLTVEKGQKVTITGELESGEIDVSLFSTKALEVDESLITDGEADAEELIEAIGDSTELDPANAAFTAQVTGNDVVTPDLEEGEYIVVISVVENGTTGTLTIEAE